MFNVTNWLLGQALFGKLTAPRSSGYNPMAASGVSGAVQNPSWHQTYPDAERAALINALHNESALDDRGPVDARDAGSPGMWSDQLTPPHQRRSIALPIPTRSPRSFSEDYPPSLWDHQRRTAVDANGALLRDMEGRRLRAEYVVGRRNRGGPDVGLQPQEMVDVTTKLLGAPPRFLSEEEMRQEYETPTPPVGRTWRRLPGWPRSVDIGSDLDPGGRTITAGHELGHVLGHTTDFTTSEMMAELRALYNTVNNPNRTSDGRDAASGRAVTPETFGYRYWRDIHDEYVAEAYRAYMADPNFVKTVAPNVAAAIRRAVNTNPRLNRVIQFNSLKFPTYAGLGTPDNSQAGTA